MIVDDVVLHYAEVGLLGDLFLVIQRNSLSCLCTWPQYDVIV